MREEAAASTALPSRRLLLTISPVIGLTAILLGFAFGVITPTLGSPDTAAQEATTPEERVEVGDHGGATGEDLRPSRPVPVDERDGAGNDDTDEQTSEPDVPDPGPIADPVRLEIPAIGVDAELVPVGLEPDGAMEVPDFGLAGWYTPGPKPGEAGPSVIAAHVDSRAGPDVFFRLGELEPGDLVHVHGGDGSKLSFEVEHQEQTPKDELPVERIWGATDEPTLRLITCDGFFDRATGHYRDNRIVYLSMGSG